MVDFETVQSLFLASIKLYYIKCLIWDNSNMAPDSRFIKMQEKQRKISHFYTKDRDTIFAVRSLTLSLAMSAQLNSIIFPPEK